MHLSGYIDKQEFRAVAKKMKSSSRRREVISVATAALGSIFVATGSNTFQYGQKLLRTRYLEEFAEDAQNELFPTAMLSSDIDAGIARVLKGRGFTPENTLFGHSICADEVNNRKEQLVPLMLNRWQEGFALGGLGGFPFAGKSGFGAYLHHVPDEGRLLVLFAPHVGIDGKLARYYMTSTMFCIFDSLILIYSYNTDMASNNTTIQKMERLVRCNGTAKQSCQLHVGQQSEHTKSFRNRKRQQKIHYSY